MIQFRPGPDAGRYMLAAEGRPVAFPFNLRWLLPRLCGTSLVRWWVVWGASWPLLAAGVAWWASGLGVSWQVAVAAAALVVSLPGVLQPPSVWPVGVDLPAMAVSAWSAACFVHGLPVAGLLLAVLAVAIKEQTPVWIAVWAWSWLPLVVLPLVGVAYLIRRPQVDPITATPLLKRVHDHPIRSAFEHRRQAGGWRDFWLMAAPWSACLAALLAPTPQLVVALLCGYGALLVATDTVRVYQPPAAPVAALVAAQVIPTAWLIPAVLVTFLWWRRPVLG